MQFVKMACHPEISGLIERLLCDNEIPSATDEDDEEFLRAATPAHIVGHSLLADVGISSALSMLTTSGQVHLDSKEHRYVSGDTSNVQEFSDPSITDFVRELFHRVASATGSSLAAHDLYHAHLLVDIIDDDGASTKVPAKNSPSKVDLGFLFHAKEHPKEFTLSSTEIPPIGANVVGGDVDPRIGTNTSVFDVDYCKRNVLWLASTNRLYVLLPQSPDFPLQLFGESPWVAHFYTVSASAFSPYIADVNYLPATPIKVSDSPSMSTASNPSHPRVVLCIFSKYVTKHAAIETDHQSNTFDTPPERGTGCARDGDHERQTHALSALLRYHASGDGEQMLCDEGSPRTRSTVTAQAVSHALKLTDGNEFRATCLLRCAIALVAAQGCREEPSPQHPSTVAGRETRARESAVGLHFQHPSYSTGKLMALQDAVQVCHVALDTLGPTSADDQSGIDVVVRLVLASDRSSDGIRALCARVAHTNRMAACVRAGRRFHHLVHRRRGTSRTPEILPTPMLPLPHSKRPATLPVGNGAAPDHVTLPRGMQATGENTSVWAVLVAGETGSTRFPDSNGQRPGAWFGSHTSLQAVGRAYARLVPLLGPSRIIVIAQLRETIEWLQRCTESNDSCLRLTGSDRHYKLLTDRLASTRRDCACLLAHGGADYDGALVNPGTVIRVITGNASATVARVVPQTAGECSTMLLLMNSHGNAHPRRQPAREEEDEEHYLHLPYPVHAEDAHLYDAVPWRGDPCVFDDAEAKAGGRWRLFETASQATMKEHISAHMAKDVGCVTRFEVVEDGAVYDVTIYGHDRHKPGEIQCIRRNNGISYPVRCNTTSFGTLLYEWFWFAPAGSWIGSPLRHLCRLYATTLVQAYAQIFTQTPDRNVIVLNHFCLSGGMSTFLREPRFGSFIGANKWPIYCIVSSGDFEPSLSDFWGCWVDEFARVPLHPTRGDTVDRVYRRAEQRYWDINKGPGLIVVSRIDTGVLAASLQPVCSCARTHGDLVESELSCLCVRQVFNSTTHRCQAVRAAVVVLPCTEG
eukprot:m.1083336 g.1083336  ORF g.1083336 m.1083336 type:complete len:1034 (+) comp24269_c1_seq9:571-3672(+)